MHPDIGKQTENVLAQAAEREGWIKSRYPTDKERMHFRWVCAQLYRHIRRRLAATSVVERAS
jgi:hypothetical protein